jgi:hypothetical protein
MTHDATWFGRMQNGKGQWLRCIFETRVMPIGLLNLSYCLLLGYRLFMSYHRSRTSLAYIVCVEFLLG